MVVHKIIGRAGLIPRTGLETVFENAPKEAIEQLPHLSRSTPEVWRGTVTKPLRDKLNLPARNPLILLVLEQHSISSHIQMIS